MAASTRWPRHGPSRLRHVGHAHGHILRRKCWSWGHVWKSIHNYTSLKTYMIGIFLGYRVPSLSPGLSSFSPLKLPFKHTHKPMNIGDKNQDPPHGGLTNRDILGDPRILDWWQNTPWPSRSNCDPIVDAYVFHYIPSCPNNTVTFVGIFLGAIFQGKKH